MSKRILITGASSGIGAQLAGRWLSQGHQVWAASRRGTGPGHALQMDVSNATSVGQGIARIRAEGHGLDVVVHAAGLQGEIDWIGSANPQAWWATVEANLLGAFNVMQQALPLLRSNRNAPSKFFAFSGGGATGARSKFSAYGVAKAGVVRLIEMADVEEREQQTGAVSKVSFYAIAPGALPTAMTQEVLSLPVGRVSEGELASAKKAIARGPELWTRFHSQMDRLLTQDYPELSGRLIALQWDNLESLKARNDSAALKDVWHLRRVAPEWSQES